MDIGSPLCEDHQRGCFTFQIFVVHEVRRLKKYIGQSVLDGPYLRSRTVYNIIGFCLTSIELSGMPNNTFSGFLAMPRQ